MKRQTKLTREQKKGMLPPDPTEAGTNPEAFRTPSDMPAPGGDRGSTLEEANKARLGEWARNRCWSVVTDTWSLHYLVVDDRGLVACVVPLRDLGGTWRAVQGCLDFLIPDEERHQLEAPEAKHKDYLLRCAFAALGIEVLDGEKFDRLADLILRRGLELLAARGVLDKLSDKSNDAHYTKQTVIDADRELAHIERFPSQFQTHAQFGILCKKLGLTSKEIPVPLFEQRSAKAPPRRPDGGYDPNLTLVAHADGTVTRTRKPPQKTKPD